MSENVFDLFDEDETPGTAVAIPDSFVPDAVTVLVDGESHVIAPERGRTYGAAVEYLAKIDKVAEARKAKEAHNGQKKLVKEKIEELRREFGAKLAILNDELAALDSQNWEVESAARAAERELQAALQTLRDYLESEAVLMAVKENEARFDLMTKDLEWYDKALTHQKDGARILATAKRGILGDKMGLGKTLTSLMTADMVNAQRVLIIVPDDVVANFYREASRWAPHRQTFYLAKLSKTQREMMIGIIKNLDNFVVIIN